MIRRLVCFAGAVMAVGAVSVSLAPAVSAHPLGNFTRNTYVGFTVTPDRVDVDHVLDLAEVPTFQERRAMDLDGDGAVSGSEAATWGRTRCATTATQLAASTNLGPVAWIVRGSSVAFPEGQGGLPTTRLECTLTASASGATSLDAEVSVEQGRVGWHEITAIGEGVSLTSDVPRTSTSGRLTAYPVGVAPPTVAGVALTWTPTTALGMAPDAAGGARVSDSAAVSAVTSIAPRGLDRATRAFTDLVGRHDITLGFGLLALVIALGLGGLHALAPGHGKTLMAASLVGTGGRRRDAFVLGASVTTAHTAGVVVLAVALSLSSTIAPETAYPWLGLASAVLAVGVGVSLLRQARGGRTQYQHGHPHPHPHPHSHPHPHPHSHPHEPRSHQPHTHDPDHGHHTLTLALPLTATETITAPAARPATPRVIALGLAGGLVPSPSAVVVLLAGFALGRSWFALLLVIAYGLGMALTLCLTGLLLVRAGGLSSRVAAGNAVPRPVVVALTRLPLAGALTVIAAGLWLATRSIQAM
ncbi:MAG TPA: nickel transporter [Candidatus Limnocylindria bacterium]|nr:nickel transporter [Candidatus Limnocylindria bacterium]